MMGVLADRTNTRWGKFQHKLGRRFRGRIMVPAYTVPSFARRQARLGAPDERAAHDSTHEQHAVLAMSGVMTGDSAERTSPRPTALCRCRAIDRGRVQPPLVAVWPRRQCARLADDDGSLGGVSASCASSRSRRRERIEPPPQQKVDAKADFSNLLKNGPDAMLSSRSHFVFVAMRRHDVLLLQLLRRPDEAAEFLQRVGRRKRRPRSPTGGWSP